ncbi:hypothetical protein E3N88_04212 [Mikania micrantha]|uniref:Uncharacterized protein n=1 Tax=Mikania micrantha TaxID=192012 RepID=A0A5N6PTR6_9ASTR|nr:hypothetical protein E3N88_04212 [Mikania micrantha]
MIELVQPIRNRRRIPATAANRRSEVLIEPDLKEIAIRVSGEVAAAAATLDLGFLEPPPPPLCSRFRVPAPPRRGNPLLPPPIGTIRGFGLETLGFTGLEFVFLFRLTHNQLKKEEPGYVNIQHSGEDLSAGDHQDEIEMFVGCGSRLIGLSRNLDVVQTMDKTWRKWNQLLGDMGLRITGRNGPTSE